MIDVNWDDNAKAAVNTYNDWALENDLGIHAFFEHLTNNGHTQPKTVADAVAEHKGKWPFSHSIVMMWYSPKHGHFFAFGEGYDFCEGEYQVCTRAEFEAYVKEQESKITMDDINEHISTGEQEGEKWTHTYDGQKVRWLGDKPDSCEEMAIQYQSGEYGLARVSALKPIKPTISEDAKRQLELYVQYRVDKYGDYAMKSDLSDYMSHHDII